MGGVEKNGDHYAISAKLINGLIMAIFGAIFTIGGYMVVWAVQDSARNSTMDNRLGFIERELTQIEGRFDNYPPDWLVMRVNNNSVAIRELETDMRND